MTLLAGFTLGQVLTPSEWAKSEILHEVSKVRGVSNGHRRQSSGFWAKANRKKKTTFGFKVIAYEMEIPINNFDLSAAATSSPISFSAHTIPSHRRFMTFQARQGLT